MQQADQSGDGMAPNEAGWRFAGIHTPSYTQIPDEAFDELMPRVSPAAWVSFCYIMRRTFGFKKREDEISLKQLTSGIRMADGRVLDRGTGLSRPTVIRAVRELEDVGAIETVRRRDNEKGDQATLYYVRFAEAAEPSAASDLDTACKAALLPPVKLLYRGQLSSLTGGSKAALPTKDSKQKTVHNKQISSDRARLDRRTKSFDPLSTVGGGTRARAEKTQGRKFLPDDDVTTLIESFSAKLGGPTGVREEIERALTHEAAQRYGPNMGPYVRGWLKDQVTIVDRAARAGPASAPGRGNGWYTGSVRHPTTDWNDPATLEYARSIGAVGDID